MDQVNEMLDFSSVTSGAVLQPVSFFGSDRKLQYMHKLRTLNEKLESAYRSPSLFDAILKRS